MPFDLDCSSFAGGPVTLPGCATFTIQVNCFEATAFNVVYFIPGPIVTFPSGSKQEGPFAQLSPAGSTPIARFLCFAPATGLLSFQLGITITEVATGNERSCLLDVRVP